MRRSAETKKPESLSDLVTNATRMNFLTPPSTLYKDSHRLVGTVNDERGHANTRIKDIEGALQPGFWLVDYLPNTTEQIFSLFVLQPTQSSPTEQVVSRLSTVGSLDVY